MIGSLTVLKENVSIDAKMIDVAGSRPTMAFFEQADSLGGVITRINTMAADINTKTVRSNGNGRATCQSGSAAATSHTVPNRPRAGDRHAHPERLLRRAVAHRMRKADRPLS